MAKHHMIHAGDRIVVGLSGGADSVCLLFLLQTLAPSMGFSLEAVHINHQLRKEADEEEDFVKKLCESQGIPCEAVKVNAGAYAEAEGIGLEEAARWLRYQVFEGYPDAKIALAHHEDDQAETVLFHLCRGSGIRGIGGMRPVRDRFIRPLLCVNKEEILSFMEEKGLKYITDESNFDDSFSRNKIRLSLLPLAEEICEGSKENIARSAELFREAEEYLTFMVDQTYKDLVKEDETGYFIKKEELQALHPYLSSALIYEVLAKACGRKKDLTRSHVEEVLSLLESQSGRSISLKYGLKAETDQQGIRIGKGQLIKGLLPVKPESDAEIFLEDETGRISIEYKVFPYEKSMNIPNKPYTKWFDYDKIKTCPVVRYRKTGDYFYCGEKEKKKLQDFFVNEKISRFERDEIPLIADGDHILWIVGHRISSFYKVTEETKRILEISVLGRNEDGR